MKDLLKSIPLDDPSEAIGAVSQILSDYEMRISPYNAKICESLSKKVYALFVLIEGGWHVPAEGLDGYLENKGFADFKVILKDIDRAWITDSLSGVRDSDLENAVPVFVSGNIQELVAELIAGIDEMTADVTQQYRFFNLIIQNYGPQ